MECYQCYSSSNSNKKNSFINSFFYFQGMFLVSLPYSVYPGGYWSLLAMMGVAWICTYTGQILISCLYEPGPSTGLLTKVRYSYVEIAEYVWGKRFGGRILFIAQNIELLMTCKR